MKKTLYASGYEINPHTMAVLARKNEEGKTTAYVLEADSSYIVTRTPTKLIDFSCAYFGSSLKGRQDGTKTICGITHKAPISIDPSSGMYFFPTASPTNALCSWISHSHIENVQSGQNLSSKITFKNGKTIELDVSIGSILNQVHRTAQFRYLLDKRLTSSKTQNPELEPQL